MRRSPRYRHRFTALTDLLVSPYNLGYRIYNWGFNVLGGQKHDAFRQRIVQLADLRGDEDVLDADTAQVAGIRQGPPRRACPKCR